MSAVLVSPELALVDPDLRRQALAAAPPLEAFDFLRSLERRRAPAIEFVHAMPSTEARPIERRRPPLVLAAGAYLCVALARAIVYDVALVLLVVVAVLGLNLLA